MKRKGILLLSMLLILVFSSIASAEVDEDVDEFEEEEYRYVIEDGVEFFYEKNGAKGVFISNIIANDSHSNITYLKYETIWKDGPNDDFNDSIEKKFDSKKPFAPGKWDEYPDVECTDSSADLLPSNSQYLHRLTVTLSNGKQFSSNWEKHYVTNFAVTDDGIDVISDPEKTSHLFPPKDWNKYFRHVPRTSDIGYVEEADEGYDEKADEKTDEESDEVPGEANRTVIKEKIS